MRLGPIKASSVLAAIIQVAIIRRVVASHKRPSTREQEDMICEALLDNYRATCLNMAQYKRPLGGSSCIYRDSQNTTNAICDDCFGKLKAQYSRNVKTPSRDSGCHLAFMQYVEVLNANYHILELSEMGNYGEAINELFRKPAQESIFSAIYNMPLETPEDMLSFQRHLTTYQCQLPRHCEGILTTFISLYDDVIDGSINRQELAHGSGNSNGRGIAQSSDEPVVAFKMPKLSGGNALVFKNVVTPKKGHGNHHHKYREFQKMKDSENNRALISRIMAMKAAIKKKTKVNSQAIAKEHYSTVVLNILQSEKPSDELVAESISLYSEIDFPEISFSMPHHLITHGVDNARLYAGKIEKAIKKIILNNGVVEKENIYNIFRFYAVCHRLKISDFVQFSHLVCNKISKISDEKKRNVFMKLHEELFARVIASLDTAGQNHEMLICLDGLAKKYPAQKDGIDSKVGIFARELSSAVDPIRSILMICNNLCALEKYGILKNFLNRLSEHLDIEQVVELLSGVMSMGECKMSDKICILFEFVDSNIVNVDDCDNLLDNIGERHDAKIAVALAVSAFIYNACVCAPGCSARDQKCECLRELLNNQIRMHGQIWAKYPELFIYDESVGGGYYTNEYYVLHAYDIGLKRYCDTLDPNEFWRTQVYPQYRLDFFNSVWRCLGKIGAISAENPCYKDIRKIKIDAFRYLRQTYSLDAKDQYKLTCNIISDLLESGTPLPDVQDVYLRDTPLPDAQDATPLPDAQDATPLPDAHDVYLKGLNSADQKSSDGEPINDSGMYKNYLLIEYFLLYCNTSSKSHSISLSSSVDITPIQDKIMQYFIRVLVELDKDGIGIGTKVTFKSLVYCYCEAIYTWGIDNIGAIPELNELMTGIILKIADVWARNFYDMKGNRLLSDMQLEIWALYDLINNHMKAFRPPSLTVNLYKPDALANAATYRMHLD